MKSIVSRSEPLRRRLPLSPEFDQPVLERGGSAVAGQLGEGRVEGDEYLERRLTVATVVDVKPGSQRQLLAGQGSLAAAQHRRQTGLWLEHPGPALTVGTVA